MISHIEAQALISARLDGPLDPVADRELAAHLATCSRCRAFAQSSETLAQGLRELPYLPASPTVTRGVLEYVEAGRSPWARFGGVLNANPGPALSTIAAIALVFALGALVYTRLIVDNEPEEPNSAFLSATTQEATETEQAKASGTATEQARFIATEATSTSTATATTASEEQAQEPAAASDTSQAPAETREPALDPTATTEPTPEPTVTSEPTPEPTATAEPTPEPTATAEPTPDPGNAEIVDLTEAIGTAASEPATEPTATSEPLPEPTATTKSAPEPTATPEPTPEPTSTPEPTATTEPTPEPTATQEPTPEPTATSEPTPEPTATTEPAPEPTPTIEPTPEPTEPQSPPIELIGGETPPSANQQQEEPPSPMSTATESEGADTPVGPGQANAPGQGSQPEEPAQESGGNDGLIVPIGTQASPNETPAVGSTSPASEATILEETETPDAEAETPGNDLGSASEPFGQVSGQGSRLGLNEASEVILANEPNAAPTVSGTGVEMGTADAENGQTVTACVSHGDCTDVSSASKEGAQANDTPLGWIGDGLVYERQTGNGISYRYVTVDPSTGEATSDSELVQADTSDPSLGQAYVRFDTMLVPTSAGNWAVLTPNGGSIAPGGYGQPSLVRISGAGFSVTEPYISYVANGQLVVASPDAPGQPRFTLPFHGVDYDLSPDGSQVVISTGRSLDIYDTNGSLVTSYDAGDTGVGSVIWLLSGIVYADDSGATYQIPGTAQG